MDRIPRSKVWRRPRYSALPISASTVCNSHSQSCNSSASSSNKSCTQHLAYVIPAPFLLAAAATTFSITLATVPPVRRAVNRMIRRTFVIQRRVSRLVQLQLSQLKRWPELMGGPFNLTNLNNNNNSNNNNTTFRDTRPSLLQMLEYQIGAPSSASPTSSPSSSLRDVDSHLDRVRDRAVAQLRNEQLAVSASLSAEPLSDAEYAALPPLQRRELLASTFRHRDAAIARKAEVASPLRPPPPSQRVVVPTGSRNSDQGSGNAEQNKVSKNPRFFSWRSQKKNNEQSLGWGKRFSNKMKKSPEDLATHLAFWRAVESVNGRAAALGFMLCLAREIAEPGHPSLFEQVVDVVVPIAQSTPPFLVAVCDRLADLLT